VTVLPDLESLPLQMILCDLEAYRQATPTSEPLAMSGQTCDGAGAGPDTMGGETDSHVGAGDFDFFWRIFFVAACAGGEAVAFSWGVSVDSALARTELLAGFSGPCRPIKNPLRGGLATEPRRLWARVVWPDSN